MKRSKGVSRTVAKELIHINLVNAPFVFQRLQESDGIFEKRDEAAEAEEEGARARPW